MNQYLQVIRDARRLPAAYKEMGTTFEQTVDPETGVVLLQGWLVCKLSYAMNEDGREWWSNSTSIMVDAKGKLWELYEGEQYSPFERPQRRSFATVKLVDGDQLRMWDINGSFFRKIRAAIKSML